MTLTKEQAKIELDKVRQELKRLALVYKISRGSDLLSTKKVRIFETKLKEEIGKCEECGATEKLTIDHIIPQFVLYSFGIDPQKELWTENLQVLCARCNFYKGGRLDTKNPKTRVLLMQLLNKPAN